MFPVRCHIRFVVVAAVVGMFFAQFLPAGVFAANGEDARFDEINRLLNDPEMLQWLLDSGKFSSLERKNFLNNNAFILGNFVFELNLLKNKLLQLEKGQKGVNELAALKTRAEINNIDAILNYAVSNRTLADIIAEKKKLAEGAGAPNVNDVLKNEVLLLEIFKEIRVPGLSGISDLFSSKTDKDAVKKSLELILAHLNEKIALILETLKLIEGRGRPETGGIPPVGDPEPPTPPKAPGAAAKNVNFTLQMSARTVDAAIKIAQGDAPVRRLKTISSNGIAIVPEIREGNLYMSVTGGELNPDSVSVDAGEGLFDALGDFFFGGVEPEVSGNAFSFALDEALAGKPVTLVFMVKVEPEVAAMTAGVAHEQALLGALWSNINDSANRLADLAKQLKSGVNKK